MTMNFDELAEFRKEFKRLAKKDRSLADDLEEFKRVVSIMPEGNSRHFAYLVKNNEATIVKARLFCRYLKGSSLRIIYAYHHHQARIVFIEIYFKRDKQREDSRRIQKYCGTL